jgi:hypothetical protein
LTGRSRTGTLRRAPRGKRREGTREERPSVLAARSAKLAAPADYFLSPGFLYPTVCRLDPDPKVFGPVSWIGWSLRRPVDLSTWRLDAYSTSLEVEA